MVFEGVVYRNFFFLAEHKNGSFIRLIIDNYEIHEDSIDIISRGGKNTMNKKNCNMLFIGPYPLCSFQIDTLYYYRDKGDKIIENCNCRSSYSKQGTNSESL